MNFSILYSKKDSAGINIAKQLKDHFLPQAQIIEMKKDSIYNEDIDKDPKLKQAEFLIFGGLFLIGLGITRGNDKNGILPLPETSF